MNVIHKHNLNYGKNILSLPNKTKFLHVGPDVYSPLLLKLWTCNTTETSQFVIFHIHVYTTGDQVPPHMQHIASCCVNDEMLHVFKRGMIRRNVMDISEDNLDRKD